MAVDDLSKVAAFITAERDLLLSQWRQQVRELRSARHLDEPTLNDHIPSLIDGLAAALQSRSDETIPQAHEGTSPPAHGLQRLKDGFDIEEVVAEYNILRGCIHDLLDANGMTLRGKSFRILNRVLDEAIGLAVQTYAAQREKAERARREESLLWRTICELRCMPFPWQRASWQARPERAHASSRRRCCKPSGAMCSISTGWSQR